MHEREIYKAGENEDLVKFNPFLREHKSAVAKPKNSESTLACKLVIMVSSAVRAVAVVLLLQSTCWIGVWAFYDITKEGGEEVHWDYSDGPYGPAHWHELKCEWAVCKAGTQQSPIAVDVGTMLTNQSLGKIRTFYYPTIPATIVNDGHAVVVEVPREGAAVIINGLGYQLLQFHYHMPSEHRIMNQSFPLELHMVFKSTAGKLAVVAYLFLEGGGDNQFLAQFSDIVPSYKTPNIKKSIGRIKLMNIEKNYGQYMGSLTTPPCTQGVTWTINLWNFPSASTCQLQQLRAALPLANNRPAFPSAGRGFHMSY